MPQQRPCLRELLQQFHAFQVQPLNLRDIFLLANRRLSELLDDLVHRHERQLIRILPAASIHTVTERL
jgi:hypothetical protein